MKKICLLYLSLFTWIQLSGQGFEFGMESVIGGAYTTFKGDLSKMVGFSELEISEAEIDTAFARYDIDAPRWLKELFPGLRIDIADQEVKKNLSRGVSMVRFFARYRWIGGSFAVSSPRLTVPQESRKLKNQVKAVSLSISGKAEELSEHLANMALADVNRIPPFFNRRYDLEVYAHLKQAFMGDQVLLEWGNKRTRTIDFELTAGVRLTADPSPVLDLGNILFVRERLDELMEGGILNSVEGVTDQIAEAIQNVVFGKFRDPRIVPSLGWFTRAELPINFGGGISVVAGTELSLQNHLTIKGTQPMFSAYGFLGMRWALDGF
ncbi:MAG: hypothetical protein HRU41_26980 [Saprospiraceae bacterium]|nr:hypothetical protein [Saprospiraceae bacterium]